MSYIINKRQESRSQFFQDLWVLSETNEKRNGFFVDFGATDGITINNSVLLEKDYGWSGIVSEPNPFYHENLSKNRGCNISHKCVYSKSNDFVDFLCVDAPDISTIDGYGLHDEHFTNRKNNQKIKVQTVSLYDLLEEYNSPTHIDYLSIDTEGSEYQILKSFMETNKKYNIGLITVEHNWVEDARNNIFDLLTINGYERVHTEISRCDDFYKKR